MSTAEIGLADLTVRGISDKELAIAKAGAPLAVLVDLDDNGWPDLVMANDFGGSRLFWNQGDGTFIDGTAAAGGVS